MIVLAIGSCGLLVVAGILAFCQMLLLLSRLVGMQAVCLLGCPFSFLEAVLEGLTDVQVEMPHDIGFEVAVKIYSGRGIIEIHRRRCAVADVFVCCNVFLNSPGHFYLLKFLGDHSVCIF